MIQEQIRRAEFKRIIHGICCRDMNPVYEQPVVEVKLPQAPRARQTLEAKANQKAGQQKAKERSLANGPKGCITAAEVMTIMGWRSEFPFYSRCKKAGLQRESYDGIHSWWSKAKLRKAGIMPAVALMLLPAFASAHEWYTGLKTPDGSASCCNNRDCRAVEECIAEGGAQGIVLRDACVPVDWSKVLPVGSPDGRWHACTMISIQPPGERPRCIVAPAGA